MPNSDANFNHSKDDSHPSTPPGWDDTGDGSAPAAAPQAEPESPRSKGASSGTQPSHPAASPDTQDQAESTPRPPSEPHAGSHPLSEPHAGSHPLSEPHAGSHPRTQHAGSRSRNDQHAGASRQSEPHAASVPPTDSFNTLIPTRADSIPKIESGPNAAQWLGPRLIELRIIEAQAWQRAVADVGPNDVGRILTRLTEYLFPTEDHDGGTEPVLTEYQVAEILAGRVDGLRVESHVVRDLLGQGGMGKVLKVWNVELRRYEALKTISGSVLRETTDEMSSARERFLREARVSAKVARDQFPVIYHFAHSPKGVDYLFMEYVRGENLDQLTKRRIKEGNPLSVREAADFVFQAAKALEYAHQVGVIHRDIKPTNLMWTPGGKIKILDMGIARLMHHRGQSVSLTSHQACAGTPAFMSPEQWQDARNVTPATDIYSLGCTFYFLLTGRVPFEANNLPELMYQHLHVTAEAPSTLRSEIPPEVDHIVARMLEKDPLARHPSCRDLAADLAMFLDETRLLPKVDVEEERHRRDDRNDLDRSEGFPWPLALATLALCGLIALGGYVTWRFWPDPFEQKVVSEYLAKLREEHPRAWPDPSRLEHFAEQAGASGVRSQTEWAVLRDRLDGETRGRESFVNELVAWLERHRSEHEDLWKDRGEWDQLVRSVTSEPSAEPAALERIQKQVRDATGQRWRAELNRRISDFQKQHSEDWPIMAALRAEIERKGEPSDPAALELRLKELERGIGDRKARAWLTEYQKSHSRIWPMNDLEALQAAAAKEAAAPDKQLERLKQRVAEESPKRVAAWREKFLEQHQAKHRWAWPKPEELHSEANLLKSSQSAGADDTDEALARWEGEVEALTRQIEQPFEGFQLAQTNDPVRDYWLARLATTYQWLLELQRRPRDPGLGLEITINGRQGDMVGGIKDTFIFKAQVKKEGYLTLWIQGSDQKQILVQWPDPLKPGAEAPIFYVEADSTGTDRYVFWLTELDPLSLGPPVPPEIKPIRPDVEGQPKGQPMRFTAFSTEEQAAIRKSFVRPAAYDRVLESLISGTAPTTSPAEKGNSYDRVTMEVTVK